MRKLTVAIAALTVMGIIQNAHAEFSRDCLIDNGHKNTKGDPQYFTWVRLPTNPNFWLGTDPKNTRPFFSALLERKSLIDPEGKRRQITLKSAILQKEGNSTYLVCTYDGEENTLPSGKTSRLKIPYPYNYNDCNIKENPWGVTCR